MRSGGGRGIRTPERVAPLTVFKTAAFNHSAIPPFPILPDFFHLQRLSLPGSPLFSAPGADCHTFAITAVPVVGDHRKTCLFEHWPIQPLGEGRLWWTESWPNGLIQSLRRPQMRQIDVRGRGKYPSKRSSRNLDESHESRRAAPDKRVGDAGEPACLAHFADSGGWLRGTADAELASGTLRCNRVVHGRN